MYPVRVCSAKRTLQDQSNLVKKEAEVDLGKFLYCAVMEKYQIIFVEQQ